MKSLQQRKPKRYPLEQSPFFRLSNKKRLAELLGVECQELNNFSKSTLPTQYNIFTDRQTLRFITEPVDELLVVHKKLLKLLVRIAPPNYIHSATRKRSYKTNAEAHINSENIIKIDIKKFFPSVKFHYIHNFFSNTLLCSPDIAFILARLCTVQTKKHGVHLPTGSCISPILSFLANQRLFDSINEKCSELGCIFTLYVDDITVSGSEANSKLLTSIAQITFNHGYGYHKFKIYHSVPAKVTGLMVHNGKLAIPHLRAKRIRELEEALKVTVDNRSKILSSLVGRLSEAEQINPAYKTKRLKVMALNKPEWDSVVADRKRRSRNGLKSKSKSK